VHCQYLSLESENKTDSEVENPALLYITNNIKFIDYSTK
jgi:hypothetical protein